jgi:Holliday junction resolvase RusA-like endonuclease
VVDTRAIDSGCCDRRGFLYCVAGVTFYPIEPMAAPRMTRADKWKKRPVVLAYWKFRAELQLQKIEIPIPCRVVFFMPIPASWSGIKKIAMDGEPHTAQPDLDNLVKALLDALLAQDGHVWSIWAEKRWSLKPGINIYGAP